MVAVWLGCSRRGQGAVSDRAGGVCGHGDLAGPAWPGWLSREVRVVSVPGCGGSAAPCVST